MPRRLQFTAPKPYGDKPERVCRHCEWSEITDEFAKEGIGIGVPAAVVSDRHFPDEGRTTCLCKFNPVAITKKKGDWCGRFAYRGSVASCLEYHGGDYL